MCTNSTISALESTQRALQQPSVPTRIQFKYQNDQAGMLKLFIQLQSHEGQEDGLP